MEGNKFYLSTYHGAEHSMGHMVVFLSDVTFTRTDSRSFRHALKDGDVVLSECESRAGGLFTVGMAKVVSLKKDGVTPDKIEGVLDRPIVLDGTEQIIDHREGHTSECECGA